MAAWASYRKREERKEYECIGKPSDGVTVNWKFRCAWHVRTGGAHGVQGIANDAVLYQQVMVFIALISHDTLASVKEDHKRILQTGPKT